MTIPSSRPPLELDRLTRLTERYEALCLAPGSVVWVVDPNLRPTGPNEAWERYTGQTTAQYREHGWLGAVHPDDRERTQRAAATAHSTQKPLTLELRIRRADGVYRRNLIRAVPVRDHRDGAIVEWIGTATDTEDARQAADDLAAIEERFRLAHAAAGIGTWEWHFQRDEVRWSPEIYPMIGVTPGERADAQLWMERIHPDDRDAVTAKWQAALASDATHFINTFRIIRPDGAVRWLVSSAVVLRDAHGLPVRAVGLNRDVTEDHELEEATEQALAEQRDIRARLLALTDGAEALIAARDEQQARIGVVELACRVLPADACALWWLDDASREWFVAHSTGLSAAYAASRIPGGEAAFAQPIGIDDVAAGEMTQHRAAQYAAEGIRSLITIPLPIEGERKAGVVVYFRQPHRTTEVEIRVGMALGQLAGAALTNAITNAAQDRAKRAAERHATRMAFLADASAVLSSLEYETTLIQVARMAVPRVTDWCAVDIVRPDGRTERIVIAHADPAKIELAETVGQRYPEPPDGPTGVPNVLRTGRPEFYPAITDDMLAASARDETHLAMMRELGLHSVLIAPLTARGRTLGAITFVTATTERALLDDDVTVLIEVARRAALAIDNARLYRETELANRAKDEFLALLSHELRTPLNAIMGWCHMLQQDLPADMRPHALEVIARNARHQKQLVEELLDVARIAGGKLELQLAPLDLRDLARAAVDSALPAAQLRGVTLSMESPRDPVVVTGDGGRLQQVIANLLSNAVKFTEPGGRVTVSVTTSRSEADVAVTDTGVGIPREFLPHVFERFRQADTSLTRSYPGLGIGLWVVKQIVEGHGGRVSAQSDGPGTGATVTFQLPLAR